jgi:hypothetical protein
MVGFMLWPLYPRERGWVGPRAGLDMVVMRKIPSIFFSFLKLCSNKEACNVSMLLHAIPFVCIKEWYSFKTVY